MDTLLTSERRKRLFQFVVNQFKYRQKIYDDATTKLNSVSNNIGHTGYIQERKTGPRKKNNSKNSIYEANYGIQKGHELSYGLASRGLQIVEKMLEMAQIENNVYVNQLESTLHSSKQVAQRKELFIRRTSPHLPSLSEKPHSELQAKKAMLDQGFCEITSLPSQQQQHYSAYAPLRRK